MPVSPQFKVAGLYIADYVTSDADGRPILVGVHTPPILFKELPVTFPTWFLTVILQPLAQKFTFSVHLDAPDGRNVLRLSGDYTADIVPPDDNKLIVNFQLPPIQFPGLGDYRIRIKDAAGETMFRMVASLLVGTIQKPEVTFEAEAEINSDFAKGRVTVNQIRS